MEEAQIKLKQILDLVSTEDKEKLRKELAKMVPKDKESRVTTKTGWGFEDFTQVSFDFMTVSYKTEQNKNLFYLFNALMEKSELPLPNFIEAFDVILNKKPEKIKLGLIPTLEIAKKTKACSINFNLI